MKKIEIKNYIISQWKSSFAGTSALHIADAFGMDHKKALEILRELAGENIIKVNEVQLGQPVKFDEIKWPDGKTIRIARDYEMVDTLMAFPEKHVLVEVFNNECKDYGYFSNRLHRGASQIQHFFFEEAVLDKYFKHKERYHIRDNSVAGHIGTKDSYYFSLPEDTRDQDTFGSIDYGKFRLSNGGFGIGVIAKDLDRLPYKEQLYWGSYEITAPEFAADNKSWDDYIRANFYGDWEVDFYDPIAEFSDVLQKINAGFTDGLFSKTENPNLHLPVNNNKIAYISAHKELFKMISSDNINDKALKERIDKFGIDEAQLLNPQGEKMGKWGQFKILCRAKGLNIDHLKTIDEMRQADAHNIEEPALPEKNYPEIFRQDLENLICEFKRLIE